MQLTKEATDIVGAGRAKEAETNELIFEIRYRPNARLLDVRGDLATEIAAEMGLPDWLIIENRVDLFAKDQSQYAFVGFRNAGFKTVNAPTKDLFPDKAAKLMRMLFKNPAFGTTINVDRIGVRSRFSNPFAGTFEELCVRFATRYVSITEATKELLDDAKLVDIGAPLNFTDRLGNFNTMSGPMKREQFKQFFQREDPYPQVGLYYDIDYFKQPKSAMDDRDVAGAIKSFALAGWERHQRVRDFILK
jgi:hypothetical protein